MSDFCPMLGFDHLEFFVGNARQAARYYSQGFGFANTAYRGLETGYRKAASYVMEQGDIRLVLTTALSSDLPMAQSVLAHGDGIAAIALAVPDVERAYCQATSRGAVGAIPPTSESDKGGTVEYAAVSAYGDVLLKFVDRSHYSGAFAPHFHPRQAGRSEGFGLTQIDHVVGNVEIGAMDRWAQYLADSLGFELLVHFDEKNISTEYSALRSKVMQDPSGRIKLPINEPAEGLRQSQIQEYLDYNNGPGIQHVAFATRDIIATVSQLRAYGIEFLTVPAAYYEDLQARVGPIDEPVEKLAELGILVDRDKDGYLLQIFTQPVEDRPTLFFEVIERHGAQGFGEGNFKSLFEAIEREQARRGNL